MQGKGEASLCFSCQNAVPNPITGRGCSWSRRYKPVKGWYAEMSVIKGSLEDQVSYHVIECPEYEADAPCNSKLLEECEQYNKAHNKTGVDMQEAREILNLTRAQLGRILKIDPLLIKYFEERGDKPDAELGKKIEKILGVKLWSKEEEE